MATSTLTSNDSSRSSGNDIDSQGEECNFLVQLNILLATSLVSNSLALNQKTMIQLKATEAGEAGNVRKECSAVSCDISLQVMVGRAANKDGHITNRFSDFPQPQVNLYE